MHQAKQTTRTTLTDRSGGNHGVNPVLTSDSPTGNTLSLFALLDVVLKKFILRCKFGECQFSCSACSRSTLPNVAEHLFGFTNGLRFWLVDSCVSVVVLF